MNLAQRTLLAEAIDRGGLHGATIITGWTAFKILEEISPVILMLLKDQREEIASAIEQEGDEPGQDDVSHFSYHHAARIARGEDL